jgi:putative ATP-dependent endonuclease of OLD family
MRISEITIENFRAFKKETIRLGSYASLVGPNGAGKSTVLTALRVFFRDTADTATDLQSLREEDFHNKNTKDDVVITITFEDLDDEAQADLKHYYRNGKLIVSAVAHWDEATGRAEVVQYGERLTKKEFGPYFEAEKTGASAKELADIYDALRKEFPDLPAEKTKPDRRAALDAYEASHLDELVPQRSADQFYGFTKGESRLRKFIQWAFAPAVKDASTEASEDKNNAFRVLLDRAVSSKVAFDEALAEIKKEAQEKYEKMVTDRQADLNALSLRLTDRLTRWAHPNASLKVQWDDEVSGHVRIDRPLARVLGRESVFEGDLTRFGHGFQRSYLLALLQELAGCGDTGNPRLILGCEEPELHQHPPQARHLAGVLRLLSETNTQVILSTHSPFFLRGHTFDDVRCVRYDTNVQESSVRNLDLDRVAEMIGAALGEKPIPAVGLELKIEEALHDHIGEMFFSSAVVFVEGPEDLGFLQSYISLLDLRESLRSLRCHFIPVTGKNNMIRPLAICRQLDIPAFAVIDADTRDPHEPNKRINIAIMRLCDCAATEPFPKETLFEANICVWPTKIGDVVQREIGQKEWDQLCESTRKKKNLEGNLSKNPIFIGYVLAPPGRPGRSQNLSRLSAEK